MHRPVFDLRIGLIPKRLILPLVPYSSRRGRLSIPLEYTVVLWLVFLILCWTLVAIAGPVGSRCHPDEARLSSSFSWREGDGGRII